VVDYPLLLSNVCLKKCATRPERCSGELQDHDSKICGYFSNNFQKMSSPLHSRNFFEYLAFFLPALIVSYLHIQQTKSMLKYQSLLSHIVAVFKVSRQSPLTFDTETHKKGSQDESKD